MEQRDSDGTHANSAQVFIVRIWSEARANPQHPRTPRGVIEHLPSGQKRYFSSVNEMLTFLNAELTRAGLMLHPPPTFYERLWQRLCQMLSYVMFVV